MWTASKRKLVGWLTALLAGGVAYAGLAVADDTAPNQVPEGSATPAPPEPKMPPPAGTLKMSDEPLLPTGRQINAVERLEPTEATVDKPLVDSYLRSWPERPRTVARAMIEEYGPPNEHTPSMLIWYSNGQWKKTIVHKDEVVHNFPARHTDFLEQFIEMKVPVQKIDDIVAFDGSVAVFRTEGLVSVRGDDEEMNFAAVNMAHEIATGQRSSASARERVAKIAAERMKGKEPEYTQGLHFPEADQNTADRDKAVLQVPRERVPAGSLPRP